MKSKTITKNKLETYAHLIPVVLNNIKKKIKWNMIAIDIAKKVKNKKMGRDWLVILYQNLGLNYLQSKQYKNALSIFNQSQKLAENLILKSSI